MTEFKFNLRGEWKGSRDGIGLVKTHGLETDISVDPSMKGRGIGTNPDELLISALASCYMITLGIRLAKEKIEYDCISIDTEGTVTKKDGLHFDRVVHRPVISVPYTITPEVRKQLLSAIHEAEKDCMIGKAVRGNVNVSVEPTFKTTEVLN
ncbi:hypothetical protein EWI07_00175 [Sporolactobacillus sp. THM7-4]|nr:hypothetical protein EWI07_00175 [Sporolactobacillus sp. THM7-4]